MSNPTGDALAAFAAQRDALANANRTTSEKLLEKPQEAAKQVLSHMRQTQINGSAELACKVGTSANFREVRLSD